MRFSLSEDLNSISFEIDAGADSSFEYIDQDTFRIGEDTYRRV